MLIGNVPGLAPNQPSGGAANTSPPSNPVPQSNYTQVSPQHQQSGLPYATNKNPFVACVLSLVIVGTGQFYNGDWVKGLGHVVYLHNCLFLFYGDFMVNVGAIFGLRCLPRCRSSETSVQGIPYLVLGQRYRRDVPR